MTHRGTGTARRWALAIAAAAFGFGGNASAILIDRGPDMVYDTVLDITWTQDASLSGGMRWDDANTWAANLVYGSFDDWRVATIDELSHMYYINLGGCFIPCADSDRTGNQTVGGVTLNNIQGMYWSSTEVGGVDVLYLNFFNGEVNNLFPEGGTALPAWAVRPGDVAAAPEPGSLLLLGLGALGLGWIRHRRN